MATGKLTTSLTKSEVKRCIDPPRFGVLKRPVFASQQAEPPRSVNASLASPSTCMGLGYLTSSACGTISRNSRTAVVADDPACGPPRLMRSRDFERAFVRFQGLGPLKVRIAPHLHHCRSPCQ